MNHNKYLGFQIRFIMSYLYMRLVNYSYHYLNKKYLNFLIKFTINLILSHVNYRYHYLQKKYIGFVKLSYQGLATYQITKVGLTDCSTNPWHSNFQITIPLIFFILSYMQMLFCFLEYPDRYSFLESCSLSFRKERRKYLQGVFQKTKKTFAYK